MLLQAYRLLLRNRLLHARHPAHALPIYVVAVDIQVMFGKEAEYQQVNIGFRHIGSMKETIQYMSDKGMFL